MAIPLNVAALVTPWRLSILALAATLLLSFLYIKTQSIPPQTHEQTLYGITKLQGQFTQVNQYLFETRFGLITHYDPLTNSLRQLIEFNQQFAHEFNPEIKQILFEELQQLEQAIQTKQDKIEDFKSYYAVLTNSLAYFPHAAERFHQHAIGLGIPREQLEPIHDLVNGVLNFSLTSKEEYLDKITHSIATLSTLRESYPVPLQKDLDAALTHAIFSLSNKQHIDQLLYDAGHADHNALLNDLRSGYIAYYEQRDKEASLYRIILIGITALLMIATLALLLYLSKLTKRLQATVKSLNFQKFALDQHAIVSIADKFGNITYANEKFCDITGYTHSELIGQNHRIIKSDYHSRAFFKQMWDVIIQGQVWHGEIKNFAKDGTPYWVSSTIVPFMDESGTPFQYISIRTDITERKIFEAELQLAIQQAQAANEAKSRFLATMTHELRTPLNAVLGMLHILAEEPLSPSQRKHLATATSSGELLLTIINDILDFSKMEADKLELEHIPYPPKILLEETSASLALTAYNKRLELFCDINALPDCTVDGDPTRVRQILVNLLSNAIKFTQQGEVLVTASLQGKQLILSVQDSGIGMSPEQVAVIFNPFSQGDSSTTRKFGGTGLGLSICTRLAQAMDGELSVFSVPGEGSTFTLSLPAHNLTLEALPAQPSKQLFDHRILLVSSHPTARKLIEKSLKNWGFSQVLGVESGQIALARIHRKMQDGAPFNLVIIDISTHGNDEITLIEHLKKLPHPITQILLEPLGQQINEPGEGIWLSKPLRQSELYNALLQAFTPADSQSLFPEQSTVPAEAFLSGYKLLLVEDNPVNQQVAQALLAKSGAEIECRGNGVEAIQAVKSQRYDAILMDIQMPELDGLEATRQIRAMGHPYNEIPIIAMTANAFESDHQKSLDAGMNAHMTKPLNSKTLFSELAHWLKLNGRDHPQSLPATQPDTLPAAPIDNTTEHQISQLMQQLTAALYTDLTCAQEILKQLVTTAKDTPWQAQVAQIKAAMDCFDTLKAGQLIKMLAKEPLIKSYHHSGLQADPPAGSQLP